MAFVRVLSDLVKGCQLFRFSHIILVKVRAVKVRSRFGLGSVRVRSGFGQGLVRVRSGFSQSSFRVRLRI